MGNAFLSKAPRKSPGKIKNPMLPVVDESDENQDEYADAEAKKVGGVTPSLGTQKKPSDAKKKKSAKGMEHMKSKDKNVKRQFSDVEKEVASRFGRDVGVYADMNPEDFGEMPVDETIPTDPGAPVEEPAAMEPAPVEESKPVDAKALMSEKVDALKAILDNKELDISAKQKKEIETAIDELSRYPAIIDQVDEYVKEFAAVPEAAATEEAAAATA